MRIMLSLSLDSEALEGEDGKAISEETIKEELTDMLFETCESWVLRGQMPDLEFEDREDIKPHLKDILSECNSKTDIEQIRHNVFEIAEHLGIDTGDIK